MINPTLEGLTARHFELERIVKNSGPHSAGLKIELKPGVTIGRIQPAMVLATLIVASHLQQYTGTLTITSGDEGQTQQPPIHSAKSKHWTGNALDYRTRHLDDTTAQLVAGEIEAALGVDFDVILHIEPDNKHLHIEFDPWDPGQAPLKHRRNE